MTETFPARSSKALKEWSAVCRAMSAGSQTIFLRAGGLDDPAGRFGFPENAFWLFPTRYHEAASRLTAWATDFAIEAGCAGGPAMIDLLAVVEEVRWVDDARLLDGLIPLHVLADDVVRQRFAYRQPGLTAALVRIWRREEPHLLEETPEMDGCRSWLDLPHALSCDGMQPVLPEEVWFDRRERFFQAVTPGG
ncbi:MAG: DUF1802 family protein [Pirellulales bacterium]|jgi:hypothetical protein